MAQPGEDYLTFSYPPYALIPVWILVFLPFQWAQAIWMATLIIGFVFGLILLFPQAPKVVSPFHTFDLPGHVWYFNGKFCHSNCDHSSVQYQILFL